MIHQSGIVRCAVWLAILSLGVSACGVGAPTPLPTATTVPTPMLTAAPTDAPMPPDLVARAVAGLEALDEAKSLEFTAETSSFLAQEFKNGGQTTYKSDAFQRTLDTGQWQVVDGSVQARLTREFSMPTTPFVPISGEMRHVGDDTYLRLHYTSAAENMPAIPAGWLRINGAASTICWLAASYLLPADMFRRVQGPASTLLLGHTTAELARAIRENLTDASEEAAKLDDGTPVQRISLSLQAGSVRTLASMIDLSDPAVQLLFRDPQDSSATVHFSLDKAGQLLALETNIGVQVKDADFGGIGGMPAGTTWDVSAGQTVKWKLVSVDESLPAVELPPAQEMEPLPALVSVGAATLPFGTLGEFDAQLHGAVASGNLDAWWAGFAQAQPMPLVFDDCAVFLARSKAEQVTWSGDWTGIIGMRLEHLVGTDVWISAARLPRDARLEYQIAFDGQSGLDPLNTLVETGGLGSKSVLLMPDYVAPDYFGPPSAAWAGTLSDDQVITSTNLGYGVRYWVYTPANYEQMSKLPVLYVTDGQDYLQFGHMQTALDNLIGAGRVGPLIAVFIDPRDLKTGENQREKQFLDNPAFGQFVADELVPLIDRTYRTEPAAAQRALLGASYGAYAAAYIALRHSDTIGLFAMQSPAFWPNEAILEDYRKADRLPIKVFISAGVMNDTSYYGRQMRDILQEKGYPFVYIESNEGHSYGNWRGKFGQLLSYLFAAQ
jgi:enterochelin esterase-like enzyme